MTGRPRVQQTDGRRCRRTRVVLDAAE